MKKLLLISHAIFFGFLVGIIFGLSIKTSPKFRALVIPQGIRGEEFTCLIKINPNRVNPDGSRGGFDISTPEPGDVVNISVASATEKKKKEKALSRR